MRQEQDYDHIEVPIYVMTHPNLTIEDKDFYIKWLGYRRNHPNEVINHELVAKEFKVPLNVAKGHYDALAKERILETVELFFTIGSNPKEGK